MIATPLGKLPDGRKINMTVAVDLTEKKKAEEELKNQNILLETILENLPVGIWLANANGKLIRSNKAARKIWEGERFVEIDEYFDTILW